MTMVMPNMHKMVVWLPMNFLKLFDVQNQLKNAFTPLKKKTVSSAPNLPKIGGGGIFGCFASFPKTTKIGQK